MVDLDHQIGPPYVEWLPLLWNVEAARIASITPHLYADERQARANAMDRAFADPASE